MRFRLRGGAVIALLALVWFVVSAVPAGATVNGPCTGTIAGTTIDSGHDTAGSAVHIDVHSEVTYAGETTNGATVQSVEYSLEVLDLAVRTARQSGNGPTWSGTVQIDDYTWAGVGLYRLRGTVFGTGGETICTGTSYICIDGKSPFTTVAGATAVGLGVVGLAVLILGFLRRGRSSRAGLASRFALGGLMIGVGVPVMLQQTCVAALERPLGYASLIGVPVMLALIGLIMAPARRRRGEAPAGPEASVVPAVPPPPGVPSPDGQERTENVYRFTPNRGACSACRNHAAHRVYRSWDAANSNRAHVGCRCIPALEQTDKASYALYFGTGRDVHDDRGV